MTPSACPACGGPIDAQTGICPNCATQVHSGGAPALPRSAPDSPPQISGYEIERSLGEGGMGAVYLAKEIALGRRVAIKVVSRRIGEDVQAKSRFVREAKTLATIEHPNVVRVYSYGETGGDGYLVMEYVEGETLADRIERLGRLPVEDALRITRQIAEALEAAWEQKVIHRDIKPANILIDRRGQVRVADFGLAKPTHIKSDVNLTQTGYMLGTPHYVSPEQAQGQDVDFRTDIYSLGIMLYQMLTGERPFEGTTPIAIVAKHLSEPLPSIRSKRPEIPPDIERMIEWMTAKDPKKRPESYEALGAAIDALRGPSPSTPPKTFSTIPIEPQRRHWWNPDVASLPLTTRIVAATGTLIVVLALLFWYGQTHKFILPQKPIEETRFVVAIAPFYGPDEESSREGKVMAALIERAVAERLGSSARVVGIDETKTPVRDHDAARKLGGTLHANAVIWGEAFALRKETEIQPHVTVMPYAKKSEEAESLVEKNAGNPFAAKSDSLSASTEKEAKAVKLEAEAPNQIELRKTSASGVGDIAVMLAGIHALQREKSPAKALALFEQISRSADSLRYRAQALIALDRNEEARKLLEESLTLDPTHAGTYGVLGDLHLLANRWPEAIAAYEKAESIGPPYSTSRAVFYDGKLYERETYNSLHFGAHDTLYLLAVDPASRHVVARYALPGAVRRFRREGDAIAVTYDLHRGSGEGRNVFRHGQFERPLWLSTDLGRRMHSMNAGHLLMVNFGARLDPNDKPFADAPKSFGDLETALRGAMESDPTQPWHRFHLALILRKQNRQSEADREFIELLRSDYPSTPYYEFGWMAARLETLGETRWADQIYPKIAVQRQRIPQPPLLMEPWERRIDAPFILQAATSPDLERGFRLLHFARRVIGPAQFDDAASAFWIHYLRQQGRIKEAENERRLLREVQRNPLNELTLWVKGDLIFAATAVSAIVLFLTFLAVLLRAIARARHVRDTRPDLVAPRISVRLAVGTALAVAIAAAAFFSKTQKWDSAFGALFVLLLLTLPALLMRALHLRIVSVISAVSASERRLLLVAYIGFLLCVISPDVVLARFGRAANIPVGISDAVGSDRVVSDVEQLLKDRDDDATRYLAALVNHYAGNRDRAKLLYGGLHEERARKNLAALDRGALPAIAVTSDDFDHAYVGPWYRRIDLINAWPDDVVKIVFLLLPGVVLLLMRQVRPHPVYIIDPPEKPRRFARKAISMIVPGWHSLRRENVWIGLVVLSAFLFCLQPIAGLIRHPEWPTFSIALTGSMINLRANVPLPTSDPMTWPEIIAFRLSLPWAIPLWVFVALAVITVTTVHVRAMKSLFVSQPRRAPDDEPTVATNPA